ncbi:MAG TPA: Gfo/Idh/MocA family oxidoreductase, partial [Caldilineaceae bacterium]|nr:Gfo/Idh/MocA family oxidoreductase [Caldilineaceae bacterium]
LDAGLHVICEKPLASTVAQAEAMVEKAEAAGVKHMVFFTQRWLPSFQAVHELIAEGLIGRCFSAHFHFFAGYGATLTGWRYDAQRGGGILGDIGAHMIDRVHWYLGDIVKVSASLKTFTELADEQRNPDPANNAILLAFELANGAHGTIGCNSVAHVGEQGQQNQMMIHGDQGSLEVTSSFAHSEIRVARRDEPAFRTVPIPDRFWGDVDRSQPYLGQMIESLTKRSVGQRMFIDAILNDSPLTPNFHDGLKVQKVLAAAVEAQKSGGWVAVG